MLGMLGVQGHSIENRVRTKFDSILVFNGIVIRYDSSEPYGITKNSENNSNLEL